MNKSDNTSKFLGVLILLIASVIFGAIAAYSSVSKLNIQYSSFLEKSSFTESDLVAISGSISLINIPRRSAITIFKSNSGNLYELKNSSFFENEMHHYSVKSGHTKESVTAYLSPAISGKPGYVNIIKNSNGQLLYANRPKLHDFILETLAVFLPCILMLIGAAYVKFYKRNK